jgi:hypothetical protein
VCSRDKKENIDLDYLRKFTPRLFDSFSFTLSIGNSGGTLISWKSSKFHGVVIFENSYARSVKLTSKLTGKKWVLTNIYAPCTADDKLEFLRWIKNISMPDSRSWIIVGDFNLIRRPENKNKTGGDSTLMMAFNETISKLGIIELPLSRQKFTWSNKQQHPLLERLDWFSSPMHGH